MKTTRFLTLVLTAALLAACARARLTPENWAKIQSGLAEAEVLKVLGTPARTEGGSLLGVTGTIYTFEEGKDEKRKVVQVICVNGKVFGKSGSL
jgi:hypothetical protein